MTDRPWKVWMPLHCSQYLGDTTHLTTAQHGAYLLLIMSYWTQGSLPVEDDQLAQITKMTAKEWAKSKPVLARFFEEGWRHKRIEKELANAEAAYRKRAQAGSAGGAAKAANIAKAKAEQSCSNASSNARPSPQAMLQQIQSSNEDIDSSSLRSEESTRAKRERKFEFPPGAFDRWYAEYPHKVGRGAAEKTFAAVCKADKVSFDQLMAGLARYKRTKPADRAWCNPATWLHQERWLDGQAGPLLVSASPTADDEPRVDFGGGVRWPVSTVRTQIERFRESPRSWPDVLGPPPGQPGCRVPPELLGDRAAA